MSGALAMSTARPNATVSRNGRQRRLLGVRHLAMDGAQRQEQRQDARRRRPQQDGPAEVRIRLSEPEQQDQDDAGGRERDGQRDVPEREQVRRIERVDHELLMRRGGQRATQPDRPVDQGQHRPTDDDVPSDRSVAGRHECSNWRTTDPVSGRPTPLPDDRPRVYGHAGASGVRWSVTRRRPTGEGSES